MGNNDWLEDTDMDVEECAFDASSGYAGSLISSHCFAGEAQMEQYPSFLWDDCYDAKSGIAAASLPFYCIQKALFKLETHYTWVNGAECHAPCCVPI